MILLDWIIEVHNKLKLKPRILYLTQYLIDHYLTVNIVSRTELQLIAVASFYIALKCQENVGISAKSIAGIADGAFSIQQLRDMEISILSKLNFPVVEPLSFDFVSIWSTMLNFSPKQVQFAYLLLDCAVLDYQVSMSSYASHIAAAIVRLTLKVTTTKEQEDCDYDISKERVSLSLKNANECAIVKIATELMKTLKKYQSAQERVPMPTLFKKYSVVMSTRF